MLPASTRSTEIRSIQPKIHASSFYSDEEVSKIFEFLKQGMSDKRKHNYYMRYMFLVHVLLRTGARISEALQLRPVDINLAMDTITLITLKKNQKAPKSTVEKARKEIPKRTLPLHPDLKGFAMTYFLEMHLDVKSMDLIFPMSRLTVYQFMDRMSKTLGFKIHPHKFRHTFAVKALASQVPINVVQKWLAHSSLIVTSVYADVLSMDTSIYMKQIL